MRDLGIDVSGKIGADVSAEPGRALGRLTDLGWGPRLRRLLADDHGAGDQGAGDHGARDPATGDPAADAPVPDDVLAAVVKMLAAWDWAQRPAAVVALPSSTRPQLIASLAGHLAAIGRIPHLGTLAYAEQVGRARQHNSAQRLAAVWNAITVPEAMRAELARLAGPVLLVDDVIETGWTMTVASLRVREAGAPAVLPLVLATVAG
jgi:ATP-dependent DNA helicase RecQ